MTYQVLAEIKAKTRHGETGLPPGQIIRLDPAKAKPLLESGKIKPFEPEPTPMTEDGRQSLKMIMDAAIRKARDEIIKACKGRQFKANDEIRRAERDIEILQVKVFTREVNVQDYTATCQRWADVSIKANT